jgi:hypothetical protein
MLMLMSYAYFNNTVLPHNKCSGMGSVKMQRWTFWFLELIFDEQF